MKIIIVTCIFLLCCVAGISSVAYDARCDTETNKCDAGLECHIELEGCKTGTCVCPKGKKWANKKCKDIVGFDESCDGDKICDGVKLECNATSKKCECQGDRIWNAQVKKCIPPGLVLLGGQCNKTQLCYASECKNSTCECGSHIGAKFGYECRLPIKGESCKEYATCDGTDVVCDDKKVCNCKTANEVYVETSKTCKASGKLQKGAGCKVNGDCSGNLLCQVCKKIDGTAEKKMCVGLNPHLVTTTTTEPPSSNQTTEIAKTTAKPTNVTVEVRNSTSQSTENTTATNTNSTANPRDGKGQGGSSALIPSIFVIAAAFHLLLFV